jgi:hypothetical protein
MNIEEENSSNNATATKAKVIFGSKVLGKPLLTQAKSGSFGSKVFFDLRNKY